MAAWLGVIAVSVLLGSLPVAWILVRLHSRRDLRESGSGNVGAMNALRVSRSAWVGVATLLLDAAKGAAAVLLAPTIGGGQALPWQCVACVGVVGGHNYNLVLSLLRGRLAGGKGFAAAGGALGVLAPWLVAVWFGVLAVAWLLFWSRRGITDEAPASAVATLSLVPAAAWLYSLPVTLACAGLVVLIGPKLVREVHELVFRGAGSGEAAA